MGAPMKCLLVLVAVCCLAEAQVDVKAIGKKLEKAAKAAVEKAKDASPASPVSPNVKLPKPKAVSFDLGPNHYSISKPKISDGLVGKTVSVKVSEKYDRPSKLRKLYRKGIID